MRDPITISSSYLDTISHSKGEALRYLFDELMVRIAETVPREIGDVPSRIEFEVQVQRWDIRIVASIYEPINPNI